MVLYKVEDCNGNYMEYIYENNVDGSEPLISEIRYTGNDNTNPVTAPYNIIKFNYVGGRPDINKTYINTVVFSDGKEMKLSKLLDNITITTEGNQQVAKYYLTYCQGWDDAVNYSFLRMIEMEGGIDSYGTPTPKKVKPYYI